MALAYNKTITFGRSGTAKTLNCTGIDFSEHELLSWTNAPVAELNIQIPFAPQDIILELDAAPFVVPDIIPSQKLFIFSGGSFVGFCAFIRHDVKRFPLDRGIISDRTTRLTLVIPNAASPYSLHIGDDKRELGIRLHSIAFNTSAVGAGTINDNNADHTECHEAHQGEEPDLNDPARRDRKSDIQVLNDLRRPIVRSGSQMGQPIGLHDDGWVGPHLAVTVLPKHAVIRLAVRGWVPDQMPGGGKLRLRVGTKITDHALVPGNFNLSVDIEHSAAALLPITLDATRWVIPEGQNGRMLVFVLQNVELTYADLG